MCKFVILLNGDLTVTARVTRQISDARVVGVDGGMRHARALGVVPELWVGDFDSSNKELQLEWPQVPRNEHPVDKDKTDGELALDFVLERGAEEIVFVGGLGGQIDHSLCHITQLIKLAEMNVRCFATSGVDEAWPLTAGLFQWDLPENSILSLIGMTALKDLTLSGVKWPLLDENVRFASTLTMSNQVTGPVCGSLGEGFGVALVKDIV